MKKENTAQRLKKEWNVDVKHQLYSETGTAYERLRDFPGALFDKNGYIVFETAQEYVSCPTISFRKKVSIHNGGISNIPGYRNVRSQSSANQESVRRKYGPGGEGLEHKKLKTWIANNPMSVGIRNVRATTVEHSYLSGDVVDILFQLETNTDIVVEIETTDPFPGCHQAIKYRALRCAQRGLPLSSDKVQAILVAWKIPDHVIKFCQKYNVKYIEKTI